MNISKRLGALFTAATVSIASLAGAAHSNQARGAELMADGPVTSVPEPLNQIMSVGSATAIVTSINANAPNQFVNNEVYASDAALGGTNLTMGGVQGAFSRGAMVILNDFNTGPNGSSEDSVIIDFTREDVLSITGVPADYPFSSFSVRLTGPGNVLTGDPTPQKVIDNIEGFTSATLDFALLRNNEAYYAYSSFDNVSVQGVPEPSAAAGAAAAGIGLLAMRRRRQERPTEDATTPSPGL